MQKPAFVFALLCSIFLTCSCTHVPVKNQQTSTSFSVKDSSYIAFLDFRIFTDAVSGKNKLELTGNTTVQGQFKGNKSSAPAHGNYLIVKHTAENILADSFILAHPLYKHAEYLADDKTTFANKEIKLTEATFFFRIKIEGNDNKILIFEKLDNTATALLGTYKL